MNRQTALLAALLLVAAPKASSAQEPRYTIQDLGTLGGATFAADLNDAGWVVGSSAVDAVSSHAFLWLPAPALGLPAGIHDLGTLAQGTSSDALGIDAAGRVVGSSNLTAVPGDFDRHAFLWEQGSMTDLGTTAGFPNSSAASINAVRDVAGSVGALGCLPILWLPEARYGLPAGINALPTFIGQVDGEASDVNALGQVVGYVTGGCDTPNAGSHPYLWLPGPALGLPAGPHDLLAGTPSDGSHTRATAINDLGEIAGHRTEDFTTFEPWVWIQGGFDPLPLPAGSSSALALDLNEQAQVVGAAGAEALGEAFRAVIWENGEAFDLNDLIPAGTGWELESATAINRRGQIAGYGQLGGERRAFLLNPTGSAREIPTLGGAGTALLALLLAAAGAALLLRRRPAPRPR